MSFKFDPEEMRRAKLRGTIFPPRCALESCASTQGLLRCGGCKVTSYCGTEHQTLHRPLHKSACNKIKNTRTKLNREEADLRARPADVMLPADVFNTAVGQFWGILDTRDYMRARHAHMNALLQINTCDAVQKGLDHAMDMLRLCRTDNLGVRDVVPWLMLRLGKEQECYDFIKWWATIDSPARYNGRYEWGNQSMPYLDIVGADAFEPVTPLIGRYPSLNHVAALALLKTRLYLDIVAHDSTEYPKEIREIDRPIGKIISRRVTRGDWDNIEDIHDKMERQFKELCAAVHKSNPHFWKLLVEQEALKVPPAYYSSGDGEEAQLVLYMCKQTWDESEDAVLTIEGETAKYVAVYEPEPVSEEDVVTQGAPRVMVVASESPELVRDVYGEVLDKLSKFGPIRFAADEDEAFDDMFKGPIATPIVIADPGLARHVFLRENLLDRLHGGAHIILAAGFSTMITPGLFDRLMGEIGLPWKRADYQRTEVRKSSEAVGDTAVAAQLPEKYSAKCVYLENVAPGCAWYTHGSKPQQAAVASERVGRGRLSYVGDVNGEEGSDLAVLALCGLL